MVKINIRDTNFKGEPSSCHKSVNRHVEWITDNILVSKTCFITDNCLLDVYKSVGVKRKIAWLLEPKAISPNTYDWIEKNNKLFDFVLTYDLNLVDKGENYLYYPHGMCWVDNHIPSYNKTELCSIIASNKNFTEGHSLRHRIISEKYDNVAVFGKGYAPIESKRQALDDYMFSISIENSIQRGYFTEKIIDCFATKTVPIYWGDCDVNNHFDENGILRFNTLKELENILNNIRINGIEMYKTLKSSIDKNFSVYKSYRTPEDWMFEKYPFLFN